MLAIALAEKYMKKKQEQNEEEAPIPQYFTKLYLKMLVAKKDFDKAMEFLQGEGKRSFDLWVEQRMWALRIYIESDQTEKAIQELVEMIRYNYTQVEEDFQSIYNLHELLLSLAIPLCLKGDNDTIDLSYDEFTEMLKDD